MDCGPAKMLGPQLKFKLVIIEMEQVLEFPDGLLYSVFVVENSLSVLNFSNLHRALIWLSSHSTFTLLTRLLWICTLLQCENSHECDKLQPGSRRITVHKNFLMTHDSQSEAFDILTRVYSVQFDSIEPKKSQLTDANQLRLQCDIAGLTPADSQHTVTWKQFLSSSGVHCFVQSARDDFQCTNLRVVYIHFSHCSILARLLPSRTRSHWGWEWGFLWGWDNSTVDIRLSVGDWAGVETR